MAEIGIVAETLPGKVRVRIPHSEKCRGCHACSFITAEAQMEVIARNECHAAVGDRVVLEIKKSGELPAALMLYGIPMISFILVTCLLLLIVPDFLAVAGGAAAIAGSYFAVRGISHRLHTEQYLPSAVSVCRPGDSGSDT